MEKQARGMNQKTAARVSGVLTLLEKRGDRAKLVKLGKTTNDQLARALVPLLIVKGKGIEVTSNVVSVFWKLQGVKFQAPRIAKAWREHVGYTRMTVKGRAITPNGEKYLSVILGSL